MYITIPALCQTSIWNSVTKTERVIIINRTLQVR